MVSNVLVILKSWLLVKAIVLAAGKGTRLLPLTEHRPKHLLEIAGIPILKRILSQLLEVEIIDEILVVVNYQGDKIIAQVQKWFPDQTIHFVNQTSLGGTGDAVDQALRTIEVDSPFIVVNGDVLFGDSFDKVIAHFLSLTGFEGLLAGAKVSNPESFGVIAHKDYTLTELIEKPSQADPDSLINAGFYIFPVSAVPLFHNLTPSQRGEKELTDVLSELVQSGSNITVYSCPSKWFDIGRPWQILEANEYFMNQEQEKYEAYGTVEEGVVIEGQVYVAKSAKIRTGVYIEGPAYIDEGADIGPNCYIRGKSYLGRDVRVGNACEIKNSVIYRNTHAAHLSYVGDSILGESCNLGAGTITANLRHDGKNVKMFVKEKRVDTGRRKLGVVMGDSVKTGIGVNILPGVKISGNTWINAGDTIARDC